MSEKPEGTGSFYGTYFDKDVVLRLSQWMVILGWLLLGSYLVEWGYMTFNSIYQALLGGYPMDWFYLFISVTRPLQGAMLWVILMAISRGLLILLDIEDNTRDKIV